MQHDDTCGSTWWKAAKSCSRTMPTLDETGLEVGGCRHAIGQKAVNMFRGEMLVAFITHLYVNVITSLQLWLCSLLTCKSICTKTC